MKVVSFARHLLKGKHSADSEKGEMSLGKYAAVKRHGGPSFDDEVKAMQKIEDYIRDEVFAKPLRNWGVLVIYDPARRYREIAESLKDGAVAFVDASESSIESREAAQAALDEMGRQGGKVKGLVIYIPKAKSTRTRLPISRSSTPSAAGSPGRPWRPRSGTSSPSARFCCPSSRRTKSSVRSWMRTTPGFPRRRTCSGRRSSSGW